MPNTGAADLNLDIKAKISSYLSCTDKQNMALVNKDSYMAVLASMLEDTQPDWQDDLCRQLSHNLSFNSSPKQFFAYNGWTEHSHNNKEGLSVELRAQLILLSLQKGNKPSADDIKFLHLIQRCDETAHIYLHFCYQYLVSQKMDEQANNIVDNIILNWKKLQHAGHGRKITKLFKKITLNSKQIDSLIALIPPGALFFSSIFLILQFQKSQQDIARRIITTKLEKEENWTIVVGMLEGLIGFKLDADSIAMVYKYISGYPPQINISAVNLLLKQELIPEIKAEVITRGIELIEGNCYREDHWIKSLKELELSNKTVNLLVKKISERKVGFGADLRSTISFLIVISKQNLTETNIDTLINIVMLFCDTGALYGDLANILNILQDILINNNLSQSHITNLKQIADSKNIFCEIFALKVLVIGKYISNNDLIKRFFASSDGMKQRIAEDFFNLAKVTHEEILAVQKPSLKDYYILCAQSNFAINKNIIDDILDNKSLQSSLSLLNNLGNQRLQESHVNKLLSSLSSIISTERKRCILFVLVKQRNLSVAAINTILNICDNGGKYFNRTYLQILSALNKFQDNFNTEQLKIFVNFLSAPVSQIESHRSSPYFGSVISLAFKSLIKIFPKLSAEDKEVTAEHIKSIALNEVTGDFATRGISELWPHIHPYINLSDIQKDKQPIFATPDGVQDLLSVAPTTQLRPN